MLFLNIYCLYVNVDLVFVKVIVIHNLKISARGNVSELWLTNQSSYTLSRCILHS